MNELLKRLNIEGQDEYIRYLFHVIGLNRKSFEMDEIQKSLQKVTEQFKNTSKAHINLFNRINHPIQCEKESLSNDLDGMNMVINNVEIIKSCILESDELLMDYLELALKTHSNHSLKKWIKSDEWQFIKEVSFKNYVVYEMFKHPELEEFYISFADIHMEDYEDQLNGAINDSGCTNLMDLIKEYGFSAYQIIAELYAEYDAFENRVKTFKTEDEGLAYMSEQTGIWEEC